MKKRITILLPVFIMLSAAVTAQQQFLPGSKVDTNFHIYILMGQSNMAGRGKITKKYSKRHHKRVLMLNKDNEWVPAKHPLHFDKPKVAGVGPGLSFGIAMARAKPGIRIGLVPCAVGGTPIDRWQPGAFDKVTRTHPWDDALLRIREAMKYGKIKGILWHQGEGDSSPENAAVWLEKLEVLIDRVRAEVKDPGLPFVAAELGRYKEVYQHINKELARMPEVVPFTAVASSAGLKHKGDGTHLNSRSSRLLGRRFAKAMREF